MTTYISDARKHTSDTAETMADVRYEIDRIDRLLVEILAERQSFMDAAARIKGPRAAVHDRPRIEDVVAKVKADRCIAYEFESYDALRLAAEAKS